MSTSFNPGDRFTFIQEQWVGDRHTMFCLRGEILRIDETKDAFGEPIKFAKIGFKGKADEQQTMTLPVRKQILDGRETESVWIEYLFTRFMLCACDCDRVLDE